MSGHTDKPETNSELGLLLKSARVSRGWSLAEAARLVKLNQQANPGASVSHSYLAKLESGGVKHPSPHVLHELAHLYSIPYPSIMETAGYVYPTGSRPRSDVVAAILEAEDLTDAERAQLAEIFASIAASFRKRRES